MKRKKNFKKLKATIVFNKKIAINFCKILYYKSMAADMRELPGRDLEKRKYSTPKKLKVTQMIENYKTLLHAKNQGHFHVLKGIYNKNLKEATASKGFTVNTNLISLVASIPALMVAYKKIRGNKGSTTLASMLSFNRLRKLSVSQRRFISGTATAPDGLRYSTFVNAVKLLKEGKYPWGASRRVYVPKPGQNKLRPITIPPFMDRVVQTAILSVLEAVYEPRFEIQNRSFGFRSNKGVHDAIYCLTRRENKGFYMSINFDVKGAYDNVNKKKLLDILGKTIKDRKFLKLIKERLDYQFFDTSTGKYVVEKIGIPQGGIDSPYLWNIYMNEFDVHINNYLEQITNKLNTKLRGVRQVRSKAATKEVATFLTKRRSLREDLDLIYTINTKEKFLQRVKEQLPGWMSVRMRLSKYFKKDLVNEITPSIRYNIMKEIRRTSHLLRRLPSDNPNRLTLRATYVRYADDFIIIGNFPKLLAEKIKKDVKEWLFANLDCQMSEEKTTIINLRKAPAPFLGFHLKTYEKKKLAYKATGNSSRLHLTRVAGTEVVSYPDKDRLINRLFMKGYCDKHGKPVPMHWISTLEVHALISRFNSVLLGFGNFYYGFCPKSLLNRWIYIIRYCLLKTLAQKYDCNIKRIFHRFGIRTDTGNTIQYSIKNIFNEEGVEKTYEKKWTLLTEKDIQSLCLKHERFEKIQKIFNKTEYDKDVFSDSNNLSIKDDSWLNNIMWVNLRTQANFDFPCSLCGSTKEIEMHHIKHIRKLMYSKIPIHQPYLNIMYLRNRRQIPVCKDCHMNLIHRGTYSGGNLKKLIYTGEEKRRGYDNRLINLENQINPSNLQYYSKSLIEKGWERVDN